MAAFCLNFFPPAYCNDSSDLKLDEIREGIKKSAKTIKDHKQKLENAAAAPAEERRLKDEMAEELAKIESAGNQHPANAPVNIEAGKALHGVEEPRRAVVFADRAVELAREKGDPRMLREALQLRAAIAYSLRDYRQVVRVTQTILQKEPANAAARDMLKLAQGRDPDAASPRAGAGAYPSDPAPPSSPARPPGPPSATPGPGPAAREQAATAILTASAERQRARALTEEAAAKMALDPAAAKRLLDKAVAIDDSFAASRVWRARANAALKDHGASLADALAAARLDPKQAQAWLAMAQAKQNLGYAPQEFLADLARALELDPALKPEHDAALEKAKALSQNDAGQAAASQQGAQAAGRPGPDEGGSKNGRALWGGLLNREEPAGRAGLILLAAAGVLASLAGWALLRKKAG